MSTTIDEKVVSMQFDNKHFERNVSTTMSTLDKLKQKLHLDGAAKGLEDVNTAAKKVDLSGIGSAAEAVTVKFSHMQMTIQHQLNQMVDAAVATGKRMVKALTIDPVKTGLSEYETKINAVQVIQSNTRAKYTAEEIASGKQMNDIKGALDELNTYADKTIYNFAQMTSNVGKFVAQGLSVQEATKAIQGLANLAAASGASAEDMSRATYQMSQALGGTIRLMDWNSLRNANMATVDLKNTLMDLAKVNGIAIDDMIEKHGTFEQTLQEGWLSGKMFSEAMNIYSGVYSEAELKAKGFTDEQVKNFVELAKNAESAATEVKTFTQLWDVLKETAQSGWTQTWELIIGDFDTAKKMLTNLQVYFSNIINAFSETRNFILGAALKISDPWKKIVDKLDASGLGKIKDVIETVGDAAKTLEYYQDVVTKVWRGDYNNHGDNPDRFDLLEKAGYDHRVIQDLVNKGYQYELTMEDVEASHKKFGLTMEKTTETTKKTAAVFQELTDEQLKNAGLTEDEISLYRALEKQASKTGVSIEELVKQMSEKDGRTLLIDSIKNLWDVVAGSAKAIKEAFVAIFNPPGVGELAIKLYFIIDAVNKFSEKLRLTDKDTGKLNENGQKLVRTFKGVFAIAKVLATIFGGAFSIAFKVVNKVLSYFHLNILDVTAIIGDALVKFGDWFDSLFNISAILDVVVPWIERCAAAIRGWFNSIKESEKFKQFSQNLKDAVASFKEWFSWAAVMETLAPLISAVTSAFSRLFNAIKNSAVVQTFIGHLSSMFSGLTEWLAGFKDAENIPKYILDGLINGLRAGVSAIWDSACALGKAILDSIKSVLRIESPSKEMEEVGKFTIEGLKNGLLNGLGGLWDILKMIGEKAVQLFKEIDMGTIISSLFTGGIVFSAVKISGGISSLLKGIGGIADAVGEAVEAFSEVCESFSSIMKGVALQMKAQAVKTLVTSLLMLVAAVVVLSFVPAEKLWVAVGVLAALAVILGALALVAAKLSKIENFDSKNVGKLSVALIAMCAALLLVAIAARQFAAIPDDDMGRAVLAVMGIGAFLLAMGAVFGYISSSKTDLNMSKAGSLLVKMAFAMLLMLAVIKLASKLTLEEVVKATGVVSMIGIFFIVLTAASRMGGENAAKVGSMLIKMSVAILLMLGVIKLAAMLTGEEIAKGLTVVVALGVFFTALIAASRLGGENASKAGGMLLMMSVAILILAGTIHMISQLEDDAIKRGLGVVAALEALMVGIIAASKLAGQNAMKAGMMLLAMAFALGVIAALMVVLSLMKPDAVWRALGIIVVLETCIAGIVAVTKLSKIDKNTTATLTRFIALIVVLVGAVVGLSFIDPTRLAMSVGALVAMMSSLAGLMASTKAMKTGKGTMKTLLTMAGVITILAGIIYGLSTIKNPDTAVKMVGALVTLMLALSAMIFVMGKTGRISTTIKKNFIPLLGVIAVLGGIVTALAFIPNPDAAMKNAKTLTLLMGALTVMLVAMGGISKISKGSTSGLYKTIGALVTLSVALVPMCAALLAIPDVTDSIDNLKAVGVIAAAMEALLVPLAVIGATAGWWTFVGILAMVALAVGLSAMAVPLLALGKAFDKLPDISKSGDKLKMYAVLLLSMTAIMTILGILGPLLIPGMIGALGLSAMAVPLLAIGHAYASLPDVSGSIKSLQGYIALLTAMTLLLLPLSVVGLFGLAPFIGILALTGMVVPLITFAAAISILPNVAPAMPSIKALITLMDALTDMLFKISLVAPLAVIAVYAIAAFGVVITAFCTLAAGLGALIAWFPEIEQFIGKGVDILIQLAEGIGKAMGSFVSSFAEEVMTTMPKFGTALSDFMTNAQTFIDGARTIDDSVVKGVGKLALAIGALVAADFLSNITSFNDNGDSFSGLGTKLKDFIDNVVPGLESLAAVTALNPSAVTNLKTLAEALAIITGTEFMDDVIEFGKGFVNKLFGGDGEVDSAENAFKDKLVAVADGLDAFATAAAEIKMEDLEKAMEALELLSNAPIPDAKWYEQLVPWAESDEEVFAKGLTALATGMGAIASFAFDKNENSVIDTSQFKAFADCLAMIANVPIPDTAWYEKVVPWAESDEQIFAKGLTALATGVQKIAEVTNNDEIPINTAGFQAFASALNILSASTVNIPDYAWYERIIPWANSDEEQFGKGLTALANGVGAVMLAVNKTGLTADDAKIAAFVSALNALTGLSIPDATWYEKLVPFATDESVFAVGLATLGAGLSRFYHAICDETFDAGKLTAAITALNTLTTISIPDAAWYEALLPFGSDEVAFANSMRSLGKGLSNFYESVCDKDFDAVKMSAAANAIGILTSMVDKNTMTVDTATAWSDAFAVLGDGMKAFCEKMAGFSDQLDSVTKISGLITKVSKLSGYISDLHDAMTTLTSLSEIDVSGVASAVQTIVDIDTAALATACSTIAESMRSIAGDMISEYAAGVDENMSTATDACKTMAEACATATSEVSFKSAGKAVVTGFANGITLYKYIAKEAAKAMANAAEQAAKDALDINSPSKVFRKIGTSVPEGFAQGIGMLGGTVKKSTENMARTSVESVKRSIARLADVVSSDIDTQPTIRPVIDLSDVRTGVNAIDGMLNSRSTMGVVANVQSINSMMNRRSQNGVNGDIVSAIDKLNKRMDNLGNTTYQINGVTYDDGSNITEAVRTIVRAARIERRV